MGQSEENIKLESDTFALRRDYKRALEDLSNIKSKTAEVISIKEKIDREIDQKQKDLTKVLNDIAEEKISWAQYRNTELKDIEEKRSEADNILKRKDELNKQEESIRVIESSDIEIRNEARRLEFKNEQDKTALEVKENEIKNHYKEIENRENKLEKDVLNFKNKVVKILEEANTISI